MNKSSNTASNSFESPYVTMDSSAQEAPVLNSKSRRRNEIGVISTSVVKKLEIDFDAVAEDSVSEEEGNNSGDDPITSSISGPSDPPVDFILTTPISSSSGTGTEISGIIQPIVARRAPTPTQLGNFILIGSLLFLTLAFKASRAK